MKLVFIDRGQRRQPIFFDGLRREPQVILTGAVDLESELPYERQGSLFVVHDNDADGLCRILAEKNPGCEVQVYGMEGSGVCPAGDFVQKRVTADGVLPA